MPQQKQNRYRPFDIFGPIFIAWASEELIGFEEIDEIYDQVIETSFVIAHEAFDECSEKFLIMN